MPKSRHRKRPFRTAVQVRNRDERHDREAAARRTVYDLAKPEHQEYPPILKGEYGVKRVRVEKLVRPPSDKAGFMEGGKSNAGRIYRTGNRAYQVQRDGSLRRVQIETEARKAA